MEALVNCSWSKWKWFITIFQAGWIPRFHWKEGEECLWWNFWCTRTDLPAYIALSCGSATMLYMVDLERIIRSSPAKSCDLDPIPTFLLCEFLDDLLPFIHTMCNTSLSTGILPSSQKRAIVTPRLKKKGMDLNEPSSFRPISNLSFLSKVLEKIVAKQLVTYLTEADLLPKFQSGYRRDHSTETLLVRLLSDIHSAIDSGEVAVLALLDVSAAFDSVDHDILLLRLTNSFGIRGQVFEWLESFIRGRSQSVVVGGIRSQWRAIRTGVPQGSVLGPLLYVLFTADVLQIIGEAGVGVQQYADDTQAYQHCKPNDAVRAFTQLQTTPHESSILDVFKSVEAEPQQNAVYLVRHTSSTCKNRQAGTATAISRGGLPFQCCWPGCTHRRRTEDGSARWKHGLFMFLPAAPDTNNTPVPQWQCYIELSSIHSLSLG